MKEKFKSKHIKTTGFIVEVFCFIYAGILLGQQNPGCFVFLLMGFITAYLVGKEIERDAVKDYLKNKKRDDGKRRSWKDIKKTWKGVCQRHSRNHPPERLCNKKYTEPHA